jgi:hypothetical protein
MGAWTWSGTYALCLVAVAGDGVRTSVGDPVNKQWDSIKDVVAGRRVCIVGGDAVVGRVVTGGVEVDIGVVVRESIGTSS